MYHSQPLIPRHFSFLLAMAVFVWWSSFSGANAQENAVNAELPLLPGSRRAIKKPPVGIEFYQYDTQPLGNRKPLLLVHGLNGECQPGFRWKEVNKAFHASGNFQKTYKVYFARYSTYRLLKETVPDFRRALQAFWERTGRQPITIVALSMGGNVVRDAMLEAPTQERIEKVLTLGTPFYGSTLFCFDWMRYSMIRTHSVPWVRGDLCLTYKLYFDRHKNLLQDLRWSDFDRSIPDVGQFCTWYPWRICGTLNKERMANAQLRKIVLEPGLDKSKFICYGGYLLTPYVTPHQSSDFHKAIRWPWWFISTDVPFHLGFEHPVLRALNYEMGRMVVNNTDKALGGEVIFNSARFGLNDGITPLLSALYLPSEFLETVPVSGETDIGQIRRHVDVRKARVFRQIDHITFVDNYRPLGLPKELKDELAPEEGRRNIFEWMLVDLLRPDSQLAKTGEEREVGFAN